MKDYAVTWEIDIQAESPREAARIAWNCMRGRGSTCNVFTVCDDEGEVTHVDLQEPEKEGS
jgi:hypothetical protein